MDPGNANQTANAAENQEPGQGKQKFHQRMLNAFLCASNDPNAPKKTCGRKCLDCLKPTEDKPVVETDEAERETWGNRCTFFMSTLGMSVGLGQVWRFPTLAYSQGGGAFVIMYGVMIFFFGNALFFFEVINGQYSSKNPLRVYDKVPLFQGVGWAMIVYAYFFCTYYSHMVSFSLYYFFSCFTTKLPWTYCPSYDISEDSYRCMPYSTLRSPLLDGIVCGEGAFIYNASQLCEDKAYASEQETTCCDLAGVSGENCTSLFNMTDLCRPRQYPSEFHWTHTVCRVYRKDDPNYGYLGEIIPPLLGCSFLAWTLAYLALYKGIKSLGVIMYIMVPLPYIILVIMFGIVVPQDGATDGIYNFFNPKLTSFIDISVWRTASEQAFYSIGVAMGPLITFGSYSKFRNPTHIDGFLICLCIFLTSILCSLVVFSVLGFLSNKTGKPFNEVVEAGPGLVFIVYPESLELLPGASFFSMLFYFMLINLGLSSVTGIIETVSSAIYDVAPKTRRYKYLVNLGVLLSCFLIGMPITARGGIHMYNAFDVYSAGIPLLPLCVFELIVVIYIYGLGRFCEDMNFMLGFYPYRYYRYQWMIGPFLLIAIFVYGLISAGKRDEKLWVQLLGWFLFLCIVGMIPVGMIYNLVVYGKAKNLKNICKPPPDHGPKKPSDREAREQYSVKRKIF